MNKKYPVSPHQRKKHTTESFPKRSSESRSPQRAPQGPPDRGNRKRPRPVEERVLRPENTETQYISRQQDESEVPLLLGVKPVREMLEGSPERIDAVFIRKGRHGKELDAIVDLCRDGKVRFTLLEPSAFAKQFGDTHSQGVVARLFEAGFIEVEDLLSQVMDVPLPLVIALDQVKDPGNAGTLARTLYALGGAGLVIPRHNSVYLGAGATRAAAGALQKLPVARAGSLSQAIDAAARQGFAIYGAAADNKGLNVPVENIFRISPHFPALLILGSEESGIRQTLAKRCDSLISIPMQRPFDSLNVAQAGAICIAAFLRNYLDKG